MFVIFLNRRETNISLTQSSILINWRKNIFTGRLTDLLLQAVCHHCYDAYSAVTVWAWLACEHHISLGIHHRLLTSILLFISWAAPFLNFASNNYCNLIFFIYWRIWVMRQSLYWILNKFQELVNWINVVQILGSSNSNARSKCFFVV